MITLIVPRMVSLALRATSGSTSLTGNGGASGCGCTSGATGFASSDLGSIEADLVSVAGVGSGASLTMGAASLGAGAADRASEVGAFAVTAVVLSSLNMLMPAQLSNAAMAAASSHSAPLLKRGWTGACGGSS
jgi:hypothetical protein